LYAHLFGYFIYFLQMPFKNVINGRFKVPKFKVSRTVIHQGKWHTKHLKVPLVPAASTSVASNNEQEEWCDIGEAEVDERVRETYAERKKRAVDQWAELRTMLFHARMMYESHHIVDSRMCVDCTIQPGCMRCYDCGPTYWACEMCCMRRHEVSPLHVMEILKVCASNISSKYVLQDM
jgi:hypothetical protein